MSSDDTTANEESVDDLASSGSAAGAEAGAAPSPLLQLAAVASIGGGVIHATATGAHGEHRQAVISFAVLALLQVGWGVLAFVRPQRWLGAVGAAVNAAALGGWLVAKTSGISFIDGFEEAESVQFADALAAGLAAVAVLGGLAAVLLPRLTFARAGGGSAQPLLVGAAAVATLALVLPGMVSTTSHTHAGGHGGHESAGGHGGGGHAGHGEAALPARPYDATLPVDLSGVEGVSAEEQAEAEELLTRTLQRLPQFADVATAETRGYRSIGDGVTGFEHYNNWALIEDDKILDPDHPESLVYRVEPDGSKTLAAVMFLLTREDTLETVPDVGGELIQWHVHEDLCYAGPTGAWRVAGVAMPPEPCPAGTFRFEEEVPMMHVWIVPHVCGPFAALEGVAGGQIEEGEERACDHAHGATEDTPGAVLSEGDEGFPGT
jgi:hypothetical protein